MSAAGARIARAGGRGRAETSGTERAPDGRPGVGRTWEPARWAPLGRPAGRRGTEVGGAAPGGATFDDIYRSERAKLVRTAYLIVRSQHVAEELVQDGFVRLHQNFDAVESPGGFLHTAVVRLCLTWLKRRNMETDRLQRLPGADAVAADAEDATSCGTALGRTSTPNGGRCWCSASTRTCRTSRSPRSSAARSERCAAASTEGSPSCERRSSDERRTRPRSRRRIAGRREADPGSRPALASTLSATRTSS